LTGVVFGPTPAAAKTTTPATCTTKTPTIRIVNGWVLHNHDNIRVEVGGRPDALHCWGTSGGGQERRKGFARGRSFGGLACWAWVLPWVLLVLGGMEGVKGVAIPDCTYTAWASPGCTAASCYNARTCGIRQAVDAYINSGDTGSYGPIQDWDTSLVTDMSHLFSDKSTFNANISAWQVGQVTTMKSSTYHSPPPSLQSPRSGLFLVLLFLFFFLWQH
jgi:hypothetical protein